MSATRVRGARSLALLARLTFGVLVVVMPFRVRADVLPHPAAASISAVLTDLVIYAVDILALAVLAMWLVARALDRRPISLGPLALRLPIAVIVGLAWVTMPFGVEPAVSVAGAIRITLGATLAAYVLNEVDGLGSLAVPIGAMLALQSVVAIGQSVTGGPLGLHALGELSLDPLAPGTSVVTVGDGARLLRAYGLTPHPNILGGFLACGLALLLGLSARPGAARVAQAGLIVLATVALVATFSRGAWLGALGGGAIGATLLLVAGRRADARRWLVAGALAVAVAGAAGWLAGDAVAARTGLTPEIASTEQRSRDERFAQIRLGWRVVAERPLTGAGASAVPIAMQALEPDFPFGLYPPHLVALAVAGELGVAGGIAYLGMLMAPWVLLARSRSGPTWPPELAAASAALAALTVVSTFDIYPWAGGPGRTLGWLVIGLWAMAYVRMKRGAPGPSPAPAPAPGLTSGTRQDGLRAG